MNSRCIAITRPMGKGEDTAEFVRSLGCVPFIFHTVELRPIDGHEIREHLGASLNQGPVDWMVFMSSTGVNLLFDSLASEDVVDERLHKTNFLAVGPRTRDTLVRRRLGRVFVPDSYSSIGVDEFFSRANPENLRIVLIRSSSADDSLAKSLTNRGARITTIKVYDSRVPTELGPAFAFLEGLSEGRFYAILFTSSVSVSNLFEIVKPKLNETKVIDLLKKTRIGAIGPSTAEELRKRGVESIVPEEHLIERALRKLIGESTMIQQQRLAS